MGNCLANQQNDNDCNISNTHCSQIESNQIVYELGDLQDDNISTDVAFCNDCDKNKVEEDGEEGCTNISLNCSSEWKSIDKDNSESLIELPLKKQSTEFEQDQISYSGSADTDEKDSILAIEDLLPGMRHDNANKNISLSNDNLQRESDNDESKNCAVLSDHLRKDNNCTSSVLEAQNGIADTIKPVNFDWNYPLSQMLANTTATNSVMQTTNKSRIAVVPLDCASGMQLGFRQLTDTRGQPRTTQRLNNGELERANGRFYVNANGDNKSHDDLLANRINQLNCSLNNSKQQAQADSSQPNSTQNEQLFRVAKQPTHLKSEREKEKLGWWRYTMYIDQAQSQMTCFMTYLKQTRHIFIGLELRTGCELRLGVRQFIHRGRLVRHMVIDGPSKQHILRCKSSLPDRIANMLIQDVERPSFDEQREKQKPVISMPRPSNYDPIKSLLQVTSSYVAQQVY